MRILSLGGDGHDVSFTVLENGIPVQHIEKERHTRVKMAKGQAASFALKNCDVIDSCDILTKAARHDEEGWMEKCKPLRELAQRIGPPYNVWHHTAHAAHAFYSSSFEEALVLTIDGGGPQEVTEEDRLTLLDEGKYYSKAKVPRRAARAATTVWTGSGTQLQARRFYNDREINIGRLWAVVTRALGYSTGTPKGNQAGTVMAMAALGDPRRFPFEGEASFNKSALDKAILESGDQARFDAAASVQAYTEKFLRSWVENWLDAFPKKNIALAGGCALNSVFTGKMLEWFDGNIYVCPVPYDGGLSFGEAQYVYHHVFGNERVAWEDACTPYLGYSYSRNDVLTALKKHGIENG